MFINDPHCFSLWSSNNCRHSVLLLCCFSTSSLGFSPFISVFSLTLFFFLFLFSTHTSSSDLNWMHEQKLCFTTGVGKRAGHLFLQIKSIRMQSHPLVHVLSVAAFVLQGAVEQLSQRPFSGLQTLKYLLSGLQKNCCLLL